LLEIVTVVAIIAVLAAYAVPAYVVAVARGHRVAAVFALQRAVQFVESDAGRLGSGVPTALPAGHDQAPGDGPAIYRLRVVPANATNGGYAIEAHPVADGPMRDDRCGVFILDAAGRRGNRSRMQDAQRAVDCWTGR
jgi:type IV pilus assembly protein PilE